jgi:electron transport complex protein RnfG
MSHILKPALALFIITAIATALLGIAREKTLEPIQNQRKKTMEKAMKDVLPNAAAYNEIIAKPGGNIEKIYEGIKDNSIIGYVFEISPVGYAGTINIMVGISVADERISGMRVLKHSETPGLGALAVEEKFYGKFNGKALAPLSVVKIPTGAPDEIEAITASTITSRAITNGVNEAIEWYSREIAK